MRRLPFAFVLSGSLAGSLAFSLPSFAAPKYLIKLKPNVQSLSAYAHLQNLGAPVVDEIPELGIVLTDKPVQASFAAYIEPNAVWKHMGVTNETIVVPNDPRVSAMTAQMRAKLSEAWSRATGSRNIVVGVIDSGIDFSHPDLAANIYTNPNEIAGDGIDNDGNGYVDDLHGWNFVDGTKPPQDDHKHGTHVSGIFGAVGNNGIGIAGVNWSVSILPAKFLGSNGSGSTDAAVRAILYAVQQGAKIINNSWGGGSKSQAVEDAIRYARDRGVLFVAAAGNDGANNDATPKYPASYEVSNVLSVASTEDVGKRSSFSNYGNAGVHLAAPGTDVFSTLLNNSYGYLSGTSMATPVVSGIAALILSLRPDFNLIRLRNAVLNATTYATGLSRIVSTDGEIDASQALAQLDRGFQIWPARHTLRVGKSFEMTAFAAPASSVEWTVNDPTVATINAQGVVQALKVGEVKISASSGGQNIETQWLRVIPAAGGGSSPGSSCSRSQMTRKLTRAESTSQMLGMLLPFVVASFARVRFRRRRNRP